MTRILVVDDEPQILRALGTNLRARGYDVELAQTGEAALTIAARKHPDLVILDLGLPGIDGVEVIRGLRGWTTVPDHRPLGARARSRQGRRPRRRRRRLRHEAVRHGRAARAAARRAPPRRSRRGGGASSRPTDFTVDLAAKRVTAHGGEVRLTPTEWQIVELLVRNAGRLVTQRQLLQEVWGPQYEKETNYLRVYLAQIRRKLEPDPARPRYFVTEAGMGYRFEPDRDSG